jgi:hypothetical protein
MKPILVVPPDPPVVAAGAAEVGVAAVVAAGAAGVVAAGVVAAGAAGAVGVGLALLLDPQAAAPAPNVRTSNGAKRYLRSVIFSPCDGGDVP